MRSIVLAWVLFALFAGPALPAAKPVSSKSTAGAGVSSDAEIQAKILARLARSKIAADGFQLTVKDGVAVFTGRTDVLQHKGAATRMARSAGAVRVVNQIVISEAARQKAAANLSKGRAGSSKAVTKR